MQPSEDYQQLNQIKLQIAQKSIKNPTYNKQVQEIEQTHFSIIKLLQSIPLKDIQDLSYLLKPTQIQYNSVCGLLCFVAGVEKYIGTEYLFLENRDWMSSQSLFCLNYDNIVGILYNLQQHAIKRKINITNQKEALKYINNDIHNQLNNTYDKLYHILHLVTQYYQQFYKIVKLNQQHSLQYQTTNELQNYMISKVTSNFQDNNSEENDYNEQPKEPRVTQLILDSPQKDQQSNILSYKLLNRFRDFNSYQKGICNPKISISPYKSKTPTTNKEYDKSIEKLNTTNEYMSFQDQGSNKSIQTSPFNANNQSIKSNQSQQIKQNKQDQHHQLKNQQIKQSQEQFRSVQMTKKQKKEIQIIPNFHPNSLVDLEDKIKSNDPTIEKELQNQIEMIKKEKKKLLSIKKELEWEDLRQCKQQTSNYEKLFETEQFQQNKSFLENKTNFKKEQQLSRIPYEKHQPVFNILEDYQKQKIQNLHQELLNHITEVKMLTYDAQQMRQRVYDKKIQK